MTNVLKKLIGYGYTDSNGIATLDYTEDGTDITTLQPTGETGYIGNGVGSVQVGAEIHDNSILVSEPYNVFDTIAYFDGTINNHFTNVVETIVDDGIKLVSSYTNNIFQKNGEQLFIPTDKDFCIEFDVINSNQWVVYLFKSTNTRYKQIGGIIPTTSTFKSIKYVYSVADNNVKQYIDGNLNDTTSNVSITDITNCGFGFIDWQSDLDCTIKNLKVYPI